MKKNIGIKVLSKACGVLPHSIRTWEKRYQVFTPSRTDGGQRLYDENDLAKARLLGSLINQGHSISKLAKLSINDLESLLIDEQTHNDVSDSLQNISITKLLQGLANYNIEQIVSEVEHLRLSCGAKDFIFKVVLPVMQDIGNKVAKGIYTVTQEHIISTIVRDQLGKLSLPNLGDNSRRIALATPDGNLHELSILIADIICRANRVPTSYLGASHPAECLAEAVNALKINTIVMGVVSSDQWDYQKNIINYLSVLDKFLVNKIEIVLGGGWELEFPSFCNIDKVLIIENFEIFDKSLMDFTLATKYDK
jgi:DNA-binding transcriptional MerR regulator